LSIGESIGFSVTPTYGDIYTGTLKPAYKETASDRKFSVERRRLFIRVLKIWFLVTLDPRDQTLPVNTDFPYAQVPFKTDLIVLQKTQHSFGKLGLIESVIRNYKHIIRLAVLMHIPGC
jgi:hypothetical protein